LSNNGRPDSGEPSATTDALGNYRLTGPSGLRPGTYTLREIVRSGWVPTKPVGGVRQVAVTSGQATTAADFGNAYPGTISGQVFWDANANHVKDSRESGLSGWTVYLDANNNGALDPGEAAATSDSTGHYSFTGLAPATYVVREVIPVRWNPVTHTILGLWIES